STDDFLIVAGKDAAIGVGGMAPDDGPAETDADGIEELGAADFVVFLGRESGNHQIAVLAKNEEAITVLGDESGPLVRAALVAILTVDGPGRRPQPFAGIDPHGAKDAVAVDAVGDAILDERRAA